MPSHWTAPARDLRFDERGVGASEGEFDAATSLDFAEDVEAALAFTQAPGEAFAPGLLELVTQWLAEHVVE